MKKSRKIKNLLNLQKMSEEEFIDLTPFEKEEPKKAKTTVRKVKELSKLEKYLSKLNDKVLDIKRKVFLPISHLKTLNENIRQVNLLEVKENKFINPYQMLSQWLLVDVAVNGVLIAVVVNTLFGWQGIVKNLFLWFSLGILRYIIIDFVKEITHAIKGE